jgi:CheY-like chemotaxis protein
LLADLAVIHRNAEHLSALIDDVLDLSQIEAGQMAVTRELVPFREIVESAVTAVRPLFASKQLALETDVPADLPLIFCDRTRIREVLLNLLSNAGRFTEQGGVQVRATLVDEALVVSVADTGTGISDEGIRKLFQPFYQVDGSIRRRFGGTGLGLSISKRFIELHDGKIWVESQAGTGSTFFFRLPILPPAPLDTHFLRGVTPGWEFLQRTQPSTAPKPDVRPRFVVFEKEGALQRLLTRYMDGVEVAPVSGLSQALHELEREPAHALLINTASVSTMLEELSPATALPTGTPVFICSAPGVDDWSNELGAIYRLVKPVARDALLAVLDRLAIPVGATILIVDDEPDALQLFGRMLNSFERAYRVLVARDGQEALAILQTIQPAVLLLDLIMPHMDGFQLLAERSRSARLQAIPVVIISAQDPARQPIVSSTFAIAQGGGLSMRQLLKSIEFVTTQLNSTGLKSDKLTTENAL